MLTGRYFISNHTGLILMWLVLIVNVTFLKLKSLHKQLFKLLKTSISLRSIIEKKNSRLVYFWIFISWDAIEKKSGHLKILFKLCNITLNQFQNTPFEIFVMKEKISVSRNFIMKYCLEIQRQNKKIPSRD